jgi:hypothetical protein
MAKKGTTPYVTHFIFRPLMSIDIPGLGTATNLEAVGTTQNMKGEKMLDKMSARCAALSVASGDNTPYHRPASGGDAVRVACLPAIHDGFPGWGPLSWYWGPLRVGGGEGRTCEIWGRGGRVGGG